MSGHKAILKHSNHIETSSHRPIKYTSFSICIGGPALNRPPKNISHISAIMVLQISAIVSARNPQSAELIRRASSFRQSARMVSVKCSNRATVNTKNRFFIKRFGMAVWLKPIHRFSLSRARSCCGECLKFMN